MVPLFVGTCNWVLLPFLSARLRPFAAICPHLTTDLFDTVKSLTVSKRVFFCFLLCLLYILPSISFTPTPEPSNSISSSSS